MPITTESICPRCYKRIKAEIFEADDCVFMRKECCGEINTALLEKDAAFYRKISALPYKDVLHQVISIDVTDNCNMACKYCFYDVKRLNYADPSIASIESTCRMIKHAHYKDILLQGAEATTRDDLDEIIRRIKKIFDQEDEGVSLLTNGIRLADKGYLSRLVEAGLDKIYFSMHLRKDISKFAYYKKVEALDNIYDVMGYCESVMFTIDNLEDARLVLDEISRMPINKTGQFRIRTAQNFGKTLNASPIFMSELYDEIQRLGALDYTPIDFMSEMDNNVFNLNVKYGDIPLRLITCPNKYNIDLHVNDRFGPMRIAKDGIIYNFIYSVILDERSYGYG